MLKRRQITDLSATGHPMETAKLILAGVKEKGLKSKSHIDKAHVISIHFNKKTQMINIDVQEDGNEKVIAMKIYRRTAITQAHQLSQA